MSFNLHAAVENEDQGNAVVPMTLTRASRGITSTATIGRGEQISFDGVIGRVADVIHEHVAGHDHKKAPNSHAYLDFGPLSQFEIEKLIAHGFEPDGRSDNAT